jgi:hypothetical protein
VNVRAYGAEYRRKMQDERTTERGEVAMSAMWSGISPAEYLEARGWIRDHYNEGGVKEGWLPDRWRDSVYEQWAGMDEALLQQFKREVESLGGFENLIRLVDETGVPAWELPY